MKTKYARAWRWLRLDRYFDALFGFWEDMATRARGRLRRMLEAAGARAPHCTKRKSLQLSFEMLEIRYVMNTTHTSGAIVDPLQGELVPITGTPGLGSVNVEPLNGSVQLSSPLQVNVSPNGAASGFPLTGSPTGLPISLTYSSSTVDVQPILATTYATTTLPSQINAELSWNSGSYSAPIVFSTTGHSAGDTYQINLQLGSAVTATGYYPFTVEADTGGTPSYSSDNYSAVPWGQAGAWPAWTSSSSTPAAFCGSTAAPARPAFSRRAAAVLPARRMISAPWLSTRIPRTPTRLSIKRSSTSTAPAMRPAL
jgi:hypothetical protein